MNGNPPVRAPGGFLPGLGDRRKAIGSAWAPIVPLSLSRRGPVRIGLSSLRARERGKTNKPEGPLAFPYESLTRLSRRLNRFGVWTIPGVVAA